MIHQVSNGYVKSEFHNGVTTIEFSHPQSNSLPLKILDELAQTIHRAGNDDETKLIILSSVGEKVFCSGASFDELAAIQNAEQGLQFLVALHMLSMPCEPVLNLLLPEYMGN